MAQETLIIAWAIAFVFFIVCEIATSTALISIWLGIGALISMFCAIAGCGFTVQLIVFVVSSAVMLLVTRPLAKKLQGKKIDTNYELNVGQSAVVIEDIDNEYGKGRVKLNGVNWEARSEDNSKIPADTIVTVVKVEGAKLIVKK